MLTSITDAKVFERNNRTESCRQLYLPSLRYTLQPETTCNNDSDSAQYVHAALSDVFHSNLFLFVANVLFKYRNVNE